MEFRELRPQPLPADIPPPTSDMPRPFPVPDTPPAPLAPPADIDVTAPAQRGRNTTPTTMETPTMSARTPGEPTPSQPNEPAPSSPASQPPQPPQEVKPAAASPKSDREPDTTPETEIIAGQVPPREITIPLRATVETPPADELPHEPARETAPDTPSSADHPKDQKDVVETNETPEPPDAPDISDAEAETDRPPRAEVSEVARERLEAWGATEEMIGELATMAESGRYDNCVLKAERIVEQRAFVDDENSRVVLPEYQQVEAPEGNCASITSKTYGALMQADWLARLNAIRAETGQPPIEAYLSIGLTDTHFMTPSVMHHWLTLGAQDYLPEEAIIVDSSFRRVEGGETYVGLIDDQPGEPYTVPHGAEFISKTDLIENAEGGIDLRHAGSSAHVLGVTSDFKYALTLGFARDVGTGKFRPVISVTDAAGRQAMCCLNSRGEMKWTRAMLIKQTNVQEIRQVLTVLSRLQYIKNADLANRLLQRKAVVPTYPPTF